MRPDSRLTTVSPLVRRSALNIQPSTLNQFSTGRRFGLSPIKRVVAGSSPASGSNPGCVQTRRSSSVAEHVFPLRFLSVEFFGTPHFDSVRNSTINQQIKMRPDMHKVVVERPRWNPGRGKQGRRANLPDELLPKFEGIKRPHASRKGLTDLLGPLRRWLHAQLGRPWNDVYSEACAVIKPDSVIRAHIKTHLLEFVERHTFVHEGQVCVLNTWPDGGIAPVGARRFGRSAFYVHPETGLLQEIKAISRRDWRRATAEKRRETIRWLDDRFALKQINALWFACQFRAVSPEGRFKAYDHAVGQMVGRGGLLRRDGNYLHCIGKQQLSRRELRRYGVSNVINNISSETLSSASRLCGGLTTVLQFSAGRRSWVIQTAGWRFESVLARASSSTG